MLRGLTEGYQNKSWRAVHEKDKYCTLWKGNICPKSFFACSEQRGIIGAVVGEKV